uniref:SCP domain-containing protein n=1 Tax=Caenorhabditis tropicalis TaxID=1561998 RepID=A0A1I7T1P9_9PELO
MKQLLVAGILLLLAYNVCARSKRDKFPEEEKLKAIDAINQARYYTATQLKVANMVILMWSEDLEVPDLDCNNKTQAEVYNQFGNLVKEKMGESLMSGLDKTDDPIVSCFKPSSTHINCVKTNCTSSDGEFIVDNCICGALSTASTDAPCKNGVVFCGLKEADCMPPDDSRLLLAGMSFEPHPKRQRIDEIEVITLDDEPLEETEPKIHVEEAEPEIRISNPIDIITLDDDEDDSPSGPVDLRSFSPDLICKIRCYEGDDEKFNHNVDSYIMTFRLLILTLTLRFPGYFDAAIDMINEIPYSADLYMTIEDIGTSFDMYIEDISKRGQQKYKGVGIRMGELFRMWKGLIANNTKQAVAKMCLQETRRYCFSGSLIVPVEDVSKQLVGIIKELREYCERKYSQMCVDNHCTKCE